MKESNYLMFIVMRLFIALIPLALGWPVLAFCFCAYNLVMITATRGGIYGGVATITASAAGALLCYICGYGAVYGGFFAVELLLASTFCAMSVITRRSFSTGLLLTSLGYGIGSVMNLKYMADSAGLSIADYMLSGVDGILGQTVSSFGESFTFAGTTYSAADLLSMITNALKSCIPTAVIVSTLTAGYIVMWMVSRSLRGTPLSNGHSFAGIRLSFPALGFGLVMLVLLFLPGDMTGLVGLNGLLIFLCLAFFSGMSLLEFLMRLKIRSSLARIMLHGAILMGGYLIAAFLPVVNIFLLYAIFGIVDSFASIRKRVTAGS